MKILIVDDHGVVREGLRKLFVAHFEADVLETSGIDEALTVYRQERPDVVVLDLNLEGAGGLEVLRQILAADGNARVVVFSMHHEPIYAVRALRGGARGYVSKSAPVEELIAAIRKVRAGEQYIDRDLASRIAVSQISSDDPLQSLSIREVEIFPDARTGQEHDGDLRKSRDRLQDRRQHLHADEGEARRRPDRRPHPSRDRNAEGMIARRARKRKRRRLRGAFLTVSRDAYFLSSSSSGLVPAVFLMLSRPALKMPSITSRDSLSVLPSAGSNTADQAKLISSSSSSSGVRANCA